VAKLKLQICHASGAQPFYWRVVDGADILARSETMYNKADALAAATKMKFHTSEYAFEVISTTDQKYPYSWHAEAKNSRLVVSSTNFYSTYALAHQAMEHVRLNAPYGDIEDLT
jgi:uncharacterized protein YegP (UPF0339 family)